MNAVHISPLLALVCLFSAATAPAQQPPSNSPPAAAEEPSATRPIRPGEEQSTQQVDPRPATNPAEGTAADRTPPGSTSTTRPGEEQSTQQVDPRPATNPAEGTAADRTAPGSTSTTAGTKPAQRGELVGAAVVTPNGAPLGKVVDVVFNSVAQPTYVVIASKSGPAAVPFAVANSMQTGGKVVIDEKRLESAPKVKDGEWRSESGSRWQQDSTRYWEKQKGG